MRDHGVGWVSSDTVGHGEMLMQRLKIGLLLVITLAVMRAVSRALGRVVIRLEGSNARIAAVVSNAAACTTFVLLLDFSLMPGEPMDYAAVAFGVAVFGIYAAWDLFRFPWKPKTCSARRVRRPDFLERPDGNGISRRFRNRKRQEVCGLSRDAECCLSDLGAVLPAALDSARPVHERLFWPGTGASGHL